MPLHFAHTILSFSAFPGIYATHMLMCCCTQEEVKPKPCGKQVGDEDNSDLVFKPGLMLSVAIGN